MRKIEKEEEQLAYEDPDKKIYHLCIVNLVIGYVTSGLIKRLPFVYCQPSHWVCSIWLDKKISHFCIVNSVINSTAANSWFCRIQS